MDNRLVSQSNQFVTSVKMARSAAVRFQRPATVCSSDNFDAAVPTCSNNDDWSDGWIVWVDKNRDTLTRRKRNHLGIRTNKRRFNAVQHDIEQLYLRRARLRNDGRWGSHAV